MSVIVFHFDLIFKLLRIYLSRNMFRLVTGHPFEVFVVKILLTGPDTTVFLDDFTPKSSTLICHDLLKCVK